MTTSNPDPSNGKSLAMVPAPQHSMSAGSDSIAAFASVSNFEAAQRMAKSLAASSLVPKEYQGNIANCLIAMELASRVGASVFMVMQNLDVIHGRPSWRATFLIATVNACGRFTPLRFRFEGTPGTDEWGCRAVAKDKSDGEPCIGPLVTMKMAKDEGWYGKNGSKWKTMPELMFNYRSASFWTRVFAPELSLGMQTDVEIIDTIGESVAETPAALIPGSTKALETELLGAKPAAETMDPTTGEMKASEAPPVEAKAARVPGEEG